MAQYDYTSPQFYNYRKIDSTDLPTMICEAFILNLDPLWDQARISYGDRPDWDIQLLENGVLTSYEVKTQNKSRYDDSDTVNSYIEIGEVGTTRNIMNPNDLFHWVKTGLFASIADQYIIFKRTDYQVSTYNNKNFIFDIYQINSNFLKTEIDNYMFDTFKTRIDKNFGNNGFELIDSWWGSKTTSPLEKLIKKIDSAVIKGYQFIKQMSNNGYITGIGITTEKKPKNNKRNINIVFNLKKLVDDGVATLKGQNVNVENVIVPDTNRDLSQYFDRFDVERLQNRTIDELKADPNFFFDEDARKEMKIDLLFDRYIVDKWPNLTNKQVLSFDFYSYLTAFFADEVPVKEIGLDKVGLGYDSDSSGSNSSGYSSSSDSDTGLQFMNLIKR